MRYKPSILYGQEYIRSNLNICNIHVKRKLLLIGIRQTIIVVDNNNSYQIILLYIIDGNLTF